MLLNSEDIKIEEEQKTMDELMDEELEKYKNYRRT